MKVYHVYVAYVADASLQIYTLEWIMIKDVSCRVLISLMAMMPTLLRSAQ